MTTHQGTAVLLLDDGRELTAATNLSKDETETWSGSLTFPAEAKTPELLNLAAGRIRIDGRESDFVRKDTSDWIDSPAGQIRIRVDGNGDAPF